MLAVTEAALKRLSRRLTHHGAAVGTALRFTRRDGRWKLGQDQERPGDVKFAHEGRDVLLLDKSAASAMANLTLEVRKTDEGPRLRLRRAAARED